MELLIGVSKINKYAVSESGDTLEFIERPGGGISVVLADGQRSGKSAKRISNMVVRKVISLLGEGVRDGAAARAASDYLYHLRGGKVLATLNIISVDLITNTIVITRNNPAPVLISLRGNIQKLNEETHPVGVYLNTRPQISEFHLDIGLSVLVFTDGLIHAGARRGINMDIQDFWKSILDHEEFSAQEIADRLLYKAVELDEGRPVDDMSVVVLKVQEPAGDNVRRVSVRLPIGLQSNY